MSAPRSVPDAKEGGAPERPLILDEFVPYRLSVLANRISRTLARTYEAEFGLSIPEWRIMAVLGGFAPLSAGEVGARTAMDKAKVSRALSRLVAHKLVSRTTDPLDNRAIVLNLSRRGRKVYEQVASLALAWEQRLLAPLSPDERAQLDALLRRLAACVDALDGEGADPLPG